MTSLLERVTGWIDPRQRVLYANDQGVLEAHGVDLLGQMRDTAQNRRLQRSNSDIVASTAAVFAAVRWREQAITRPQLVLQERMGGEWRQVGTTEEPWAHPLLASLARINAATTYKQGIGGIERGKLTNGDHYWIKRRTGLGTPVEFEVWDGSTTRAVARKDRDWEPDHFEHVTAAGSTVRVAPEDVVWFRHIVHPRNPMLSLTPIGAIRVTADTSAEALRYQQRYFDQGIGAGGFITPKDGGVGPGEASRIIEQLSKDWTGTDNAHRWHFIEEALEIISKPQTNVDLQFAEFMRWGVIEVARAFEVSPITLKDFEKATYTNADQAAQQDWETIRNQLDATVQELNEWLVRPDYGNDLRLVARYAGIAALQDSMKTAAEVDDIKLKGGRVTINELRKRDGEEPVEWGDVPIVPANMLPLGSLPLAQAAQSEGAPPEQPRSVTKRVVKDETGWTVTEVSE